MAKSANPFEPVHLWSKDAGDVDFDGVLLARKSSKKTEKQSRWSELEIYRTADSKYVLHEIGRTTRPEDRDGDRFGVWICATALELFKEVVARRRFVQIDTDLFGEAAAQDPTFAKSIGDRHEIEDYPPTRKVSMMVSELEAGIDEFILDRDGDRALRFVGIELARASSRRQGARSWMEVRIYRMGTGQYVTQKMQWNALHEFPQKTMVKIVNSGLAAAESLVWRESGWVQLPIRQALEEAASKDELFRAALGDLLDGDNLKTLVSDYPVLSHAEQGVLRTMLAGRNLVVRAIESREMRPEILRWTGAGEKTSVPHARSFLALSRFRLIGRAAGSEDENVHDIEWTITERGRAALKHAEENAANGR